MKRKQSPIVQFNRKPSQQSKQLKQSREQSPIVQSSQQFNRQPGRKFSRKIRKYSHLASVLLVLALVFSGCSHQASLNQSASQGKIENYLTQQNQANDENIIANFDLYQFLLDRGATDIWRIQGLLPKDVSIAVRFKNNVVAAFYFSKAAGSSSNYGKLNSIIVFAADPDYRPESWEPSITNDKAAVRSDWSRWFSATNPDVFVNDVHYKEKNETDHYYLVSPNKLFYIGNSAGETVLVTVPQYFGAGFDATVGRYIQLPEPSFVVDPLDGTNIGGETN